jgi:hypothetical protein
MLLIIPQMNRAGRVLFLHIVFSIGGGILFLTQALAQYTPGNLVVLQAGTGTGSLANTGNPIALREFTPSGTAGTTVTVSSSGGDALIISGIRCQPESENYAQRSWLYSNNPHRQ